MYRSPADRKISRSRKVFNAKTIDRSHAERLNWVGHHGFDPLEWMGARYQNYLRKRDYNWRKHNPLSNDWNNYNRSEWKRVREAEQLAYALADYKTPVRLTPAEQMQVDLATLEAWQWFQDHRNYENEIEDSWGVYHDYEYKDSLADYYAREYDYYYLADQADWDRQQKEWDCEQMWEAHKRQEMADAIRADAELYEFELDCIYQTAV